MATAAENISRNGNKYSSDHLQYPEDLGGTDKSHMVLFFINVPEASKILKSGVKGYDPSKDSRFSSRVTDKGLTQITEVQGGAMGAALGGKAAADAVKSLSSRSSTKASLTAKVLATAAGGLLGAAAGVGAGAALNAALNSSLGVKKGYRQLQTSIALYMPQEFSTGYNASYSSVDTGAIANIISNETNKGEGLASVGLSAAAATLRNAGTKAQDVALGQGMSTRVRGLVNNPNAEQIFERINHREFSFTFNLAAKTANEARNIRNIINTFKYHMHPELTENNFLILPSEFEIAFYSSGKENDFLGKISTCALTALNTNFTPNGVWNSLDGDFAGWPPIITIQLHFQEMDLLTKDRLEAWGEYQRGIGLEQVKGFGSDYTNPNNPSSAANNTDNPQGRH